ncbi:hypothetical protein HS125_13385 [bacterium]|nr:hypothetical protein [bacterium]
MRSAHQIGPGGALKLMVPESMRGKDVEGVLSVNEESATGPVVGDAETWGRGFVARFAGAWKGEPLATAAG